MTEVAYKSFRTSRKERELFRRLAVKKVSSLVAIVTDRARREAEKAGMLHDEEKLEVVDVSDLKSDVNFSIRLDEITDNHIDELAKKQGLSKTELIHNWLWEELKIEGIAVLKNKPARKSRNPKVSARLTARKPRNQNVVGHRKTVSRI